MRRSNVRFSILIAFSAVLTIAASSCSSSGPAGLYADIQWRVRCEETGGCSGYRDRDVLGFNRENGLTLACSVIESDTTRTLSFSAYTGSFGLELTNATFPRAGGTPQAGGCSVTVQDGNRFQGNCGASPPSDTQPCQVNNVRFERDVDGRALITGNMYCENISPSAAGDLDREVTAPGDDPAAATMPFQFSLYDCSGYTPD